ncbi:MAG: ice-binding family protein, partial [Nakamurella sp.]
ITLGAGTTLIGRALSRAAVTLDSSIFRFTEALPPTLTIDGGSAATTKDTTPTISGTSTAPASSRVTVRIGGQTQSTTVGSGGTWSVTATALIAGSYQAVVTVRDAAGNGTTVAQVLTVEVNPDPVNLGTAQGFAVLAATAVTSGGATVVNGDLGISPGTVLTESPSVTLNGNAHLGDSFAATAQTDLLAAINEVSARTPHTEITGDLGGRTFHIGIHHQTAAMALTGNVTLDAEGDPNAIFIFHTNAAFNTAASSQVILADGAQAGNVYWVVDNAAGTGAGTALFGSILARGAITLGAGTTLTGRALSLDAITLAGNTITRPGFAAFAGRSPVVQSTTSELSVAGEASAPAVADETSPAPAVQISAAAESREALPQTTAEPTPAPAAATTLPAPPETLPTAASTSSAPTTSSAPAEQTSSSPQTTEPGPTAGSSTPEVTVP